MKLKKGDILKSHAEIVEFIEYKGLTQFKGRFLEIITIEGPYKVGQIIDHFALEYTGGTWEKINGYNTPLWKTINKK